jgi:OmpA-OmpF porin, OOP family
MSLGKIVEKFQPNSDSECRKSVAKSKKAQATDDFYDEADNTTKIMKGTFTLLIVDLFLCVTLTACGQVVEPAHQTAASGSPPIQTVTPPPIVPNQTPTPNGFNIEQISVSDTQIGEFPYFSLIEGYQQVKDSPENRDADFDRYEFFDGAKLISVEGRLMTTYAVNENGKGPAAFKIMKTYESLVKKLGGVKVFEGKNYDLYSRNVKYGDPRHRPDYKTKSELGVYVVRLPDKEIWVEVFIENYSKDDYYLTVLEKKNLEVKASLLKADEMKKAIDAAGHVALYINFDFDKADIKPDSQPIIDEIVKLLKENPTLNLSVEGHTDNVGKSVYNKQLSEKRAQAVASAVTAKGIEAKRLKSVGYGQEKPLADNASEEGKAKNRRVELVKINE